MFRPLLKVTRADTESYCRELGQEYREDTGNLLYRFTRNRVRHNLMPLLASEYNPQVRESLVRLSRTAALEAEYLAAEVERVWPQAAEEREGGVVFDRAALVGTAPGPAEAAVSQSLRLPDGRRPPVGGAPPGSDGGVGPVCKVGPESGPA